MRGPLAPRGGIDNILVIQEGSFYKDKRFIILSISGNIQKVPCWTRCEYFASFLIEAEPVCDAGVEHEAVKILPEYRQGFQLFIIFIV